MKNCLIEKLAITSNNIKLPHVNGLTIKFDKGDTTHFCALSTGSEAATVHTLNYNLKNHANNEEFESVVIASNNSLSFKPATMNQTNAEIYPYYNISQIKAVENQSTDMDIMNFQFCKRITVLRFPNSKIHGDLYDLFDGMVTNGHYTTAAFKTLQFGFNRTYVTNMPATADGNYVTFTTDTATYPRGWYLSDSSGNPLNS